MGFETYHIYTYTTTTTNNNTNNSNNTSNNDTTTTTNNNNNNNNNNTKNHTNVHVGLRDQLILDLDDDRPLARIQACSIT